MLNALLARLKQGHRTLDYPRSVPLLPDRYRGLPEWRAPSCAAEGVIGADACPTGALGCEAGRPILDLGRCLFCADCPAAGAAGPLRFTRRHQLAAWAREDLLLSPGAAPAVPGLPAGLRARARLFRRSLKLRQVSAGGCNACEADINVLGTPAFDLGRFGIQMVASPRHADGLIVTGPVTANMRLALEKTWAAVPQPRLVIAVGACAISGGPYVDHPEIHGGAGQVMPVDLWIPGCPPHPLTILDGLLRLVGC